MVFSPRQAMELALQEAQKGIGWVEPNPPVGCVILDSDYRFLSSGYHEKYGMAHAEVNALKKIRDKKKLKGAHVFVTLEPCHHTGKTPPCSLELVKYPIQSLTYGVEEPFTRKKGLSFLKEKKIKIIHNTDFKKEIENLIAPFKFSFLNQKSFVSLKVASSLDGVTALENGKSQWITGELARNHAHFLRATHSAVLIGVNTLLTDNPRLNIRVAPFKHKKNKVIILDPQGKSFSFLPKSRLLERHSPKQIILCCADKIKKNTLGIKQLSIPLDRFSIEKREDFRDYLPLGTPVPLGEKKNQPEIAKTRTGIINKKNLFSLSHLLKTLYQEEQMQSILVEGGPFCWSQFLKEKAAQKLYLYMSPKIIGKGLRWSKGLTIQKLSDSDLLSSMTFQPIGNDLLIEGVFNPKGVLMGEL